MTTPNLRLREARKRAGYQTAASFANDHDLTEVTYRSHENGTRALTLDAAMRYSKLLGVSWYWLMTGESLPEDISHIAAIAGRAVMVIGYVGAGDFYPIDDHELGEGIGMIDFDNEDLEPIAVRVRGDSMKPVYRDEETVVASRARGTKPYEVIGQDCVVRLTDGRIMLKVLHKGSRKGLFTLMSYNPAEEPIVDTKIEWVAPVYAIKRR